MAGLSRREFLGGALALGAGGVLAACGRGARDQDATATHAEAFDPHGARQPSILTPVPAAAALLALDATAATRGDLATGFRGVSEAVVDLARPAWAGGADAATGVIASVGSSLFDDERYGLASIRPGELVAMPAFANDQLDPARVHGDLLLTVSSPDPTALDGALDRLLDAGSGAFASRWRVVGGDERDPTSGHPRNAMGFLEGTSNPSTDEEAAMRQFVFVRPRDDEPAWAIEGSYHVVRVVRMDLDAWDAVDVGAQEHIIGRRKESGAPLSGGVAEDLPDHSADPDGAITPLDAHIRLANPRDSAIEYDSILRRGFTYSDGADGGRPRTGLAFACFQRSLDKGFLAIQERLDGEPLERFVTPEGGGFYFALPGMVDGDDWLGRSLLEGV